MKYPSLFTRLLANSAASDEHYFEGTPCWCWTGTSLCRRGEYPRINVYVRPSTMRGLVDGKPGDIRIPGRTVTVQAHRLMAEIVRGRKLDPEAETLDHGCKRSICINPWHLRLATRAENTSDMQRRRAGRAPLEFVPLLDPALWSGRDSLVRVLPVLRSTLVEEPCPF